MAIIPANPSDITADWLTEALRDAGALSSGRVTQVIMEPVGQGTGLLCQLFRLNLKYEGAPPDAPPSMVSKMPSPVPETRQMAMGFRFYEREVRFYEQLAGVVAMSTPSPFLAQFDPDTGNFIVLLEDLARLRLGDQLAGATDEEIAMLIEALARHHAEWWGSDKLADIDWVPRVDSDLNKAGMSLYPIALPAFLERFDGEFPDELVDFAQVLVEGNTRLLDSMGESPITLCHGDFRLDNIFFAENSGDAPFSVVDWQIATKGVGPYDLGYLLSQSVTPEQRRANESAWLKLYMDTLRDGGVSDYSEDEFHRDMKKAFAFCLVYPVMGGGLGDLANERGKELARQMTIRSWSAIEDWNATDTL